MNKQSPTIGKPKTNRKKILISFAAFLIFILAILTLLPVLAMSLFLGQRYYQPQHNSINYGIESHHITLTTNDGIALSAWRTFTTYQSPNGTVIIISGLQAPSVTAFFGYANMLAANGWDALLIEKRARSQSEGEEIGFGLTEWLDVKAGVYFLDADERAGQLPIIAMGTSAGGATVIIAGGEIPRIDGIIAISAYSNFVDLYVDNMSMLGLPRFMGTMTTPFMNFWMGLRFGFGTTSLTPANGIAKLGQRPILLMHSTQDWQVPFSHFERLQQAAEENDIAVTTFVRDGDWHFVCYDWYVSNPARDAEFTRVVLEFLGQFIYTSP